MYPRTQAAMEIFLASFASEDYEAMASTLVEMGATEKNVDSNAFARDLQKVFTSCVLFIFPFLPSTFCILFISCFLLLFGPDAYCFTFLDTVRTQTQKLLLQQREDQMQPLSLLM